MKQERSNYQYETTLYENGITKIAGVDEVGRGPLAGPVVATALIMPKDYYIDGVTDSKKLTAKKRKLYKEMILKNALAVSTIFIDEKVIDEVNIYQATKIAMIKAIASLEVQPEHVLIDAMPLEIDIPHSSIIKGDEKSFIISCASIIAKEARDDYMIEQDVKYPQYQFAKNKGYPTKVHREALKKYGICDIHRKTYGPVTKALNIVEK